MSVRGLFDSHVHLQGEDFDRDRDEALRRARAAGVAGLLLIGGDESSSRAAIAYAATDPALWAAVGLHPHESRLADTGFDARLAALARQPKVVAIGEIGLDFHYDRSPRPVQEDFFRRQLGVAGALDLPVSIHSREALTETLAILTPWVAARRTAGATGPFGVMHCYGYDVGAMAEFLDLGFLISIPGTVTFPKAEAMRAVARAVPDDALLIETDAPVLAPQSHRGRRNEPAYLVETAMTVAALRGVSPDALAALTDANARRLFRLPGSDESGAAVDHERGAASGAHGREFGDSQQTARSESVRA